MLQTLGLTELINSNHPMYLDIDKVNDWNTMTCCHITISNKKPREWISNV